MKIVHINTVPNGSTGSIMMNIHKALLSEGHESYVVWGRGRKAKDEHEIYMNDKLGVYLHVLYARLTGKVGFASKRSTKKLLKRLDEIKPDIIHIHNIHGYYINIELLFNYIKNHNIRVIWTLHDCWSFTGHCVHFESIGCNKWKNQCFKCPKLNDYPKSLIDNAKWCFKKKKELFTGVKDLTIVTPSKWLANLVNQSYLKEYKVQVIKNGIDTNVFKKLDSKDLLFRKQYNLQDKKIILGVASPFTEKKGFNDFLDLSKIIPENYKIVMVGLSKKQIKKLPKNILGIERTSNVQELIDIYNSANILFNPTYEDTYPTINLEAVSCGLPVITYNNGGSPESIFNYGYITTKTEFFNNFKSIIEKQYIKCNISINMISEYLKLYDNGCDDLYG